MEHPMVFGGRPSVIINPRFQDRRPPSHFMPPPVFDFPVVLAAGPMMYRSGPVPRTMHPPNPNDGERKRTDRSARPGPNPVLHVQKTKPPTSTPLGASAVMDVKHKRGAAGQTKQNREREGPKSSKPLVAGRAEAAAQAVKQKSSEREEGEVSPHEEEEYRDILRSRLVTVAPGVEGGQLKRLRKQTAPRRHLPEQPVQRSVTMQQRILRIESAPISPPSLITQSPPRSSLPGRPRLLVQIGNSVTNGFSTDRSVQSSNASHARLRRDRRTSPHPRSPSPHSRRPASSPSARGQQLSPRPQSRSPSPRRQPLSPRQPSFRSRTPEYDGYQERTRSRNRSPRLSRSRSRSRSRQTYRSIRSRNYQQRSRSHSHNRSVASNYEGIRRLESPGRRRDHDPLPPRRVHRSPSSGPHRRVRSRSSSPSVSSRHRRSPRTPRPWLSRSPSRSPRGSHRMFPNHPVLLSRGPVVTMPRPPAWTQMPLPLPLLHLSTAFMSNMSSSVPSSPDPGSGSASRNYFRWETNPVAWMKKIQKMPAKPESAKRFERELKILSKRSFPVIVHRNIRLLEELNGNVKTALERLETYNKVAREKHFKKSVHRDRRCWELADEATKTALLELQKIGFLEIALAVKVLNQCGGDMEHAASFLLEHRRRSLAQERRYIAAAKRKSHEDGEREIARFEREKEDKKAIFNAVFADVESVNSQPIHRQDDNEEPGMEAGERPAVAALMPGLSPKTRDEPMPPLSRPSPLPRISISINASVSTSALPGDSDRPTPSDLDQTAAGVNSLHSHPLPVTVKQEPRG